MINEFLQYLQYEKNYSFHTVLSYNTDLLQFCEFLEISSESFDPKLVDKQKIQSWVLLLMTEKLSARSLSRKISALKSFWKFMIRRGHASQNPTLKILLPKTKKPITSFFKESEMEAVLDDTFLTDDFESVRNRLILSVFYMTGIRRAELINIEDKDVDLLNGNLRVIGKRNKERIIPIGPVLCEEIQHYLEIRGLELGTIAEKFFVKANGMKLYPRLIYKIVHDAMTEVSTLQKRSPHVLRHSFATTLLNGGADINVLKELLGHSSLAATQIYTHSSFEEIYNIYKQAHPRAK
jgi:integrase/recombinase XerC